MLQIAAGRPMKLAWRNELGGLDEFFDAYGITPDADRIRYHRALWHLES